MKVSDNFMKLLSRIYPSYEIAMGDLSVFQQRKVTGKDDPALLEGNAYDFIIFQIITIIGIYSGQPQVSG